MRVNPIRFNATWETANFLTSHRRLSALDAEISLHSLGQGASLIEFPIAVSIEARPLNALFLRSDGKYRDYLAISSARPLNTNELN
jgi:hypothetical protein